MTPSKQTNQVENNPKTLPIINNSPEVIATAIKNTKTKSKSLTPSRREILKNNPIPIQTTAMNHNNHLVSSNNKNKQLTNTNKHNNKLNKLKSNTISDKGEEDVLMSEKSNQDFNKNTNESNNTSIYNENDNNEIQEGNNQIENNDDLPINETEKLNYLDPSFITEKNIRSVKKSNKLKRAQEILDSPTQGDNKMNNKEENKERHIKLVEEFDEYLIEDLVKEIASTEINTKLVHLLDLFPKFRAAFSKALKLNPRNSTSTLLSIFSKFKISKTKGKVEGANTEIFLDTCASLNIITRSALQKLKINKPTLETINETIVQACSETSVQSEIIELEITIGNKSFKDYFRIIEKDNLFDILIGVDSLKKNRFILDFVNDTLYYVDNNNNYHKLSDLQYDTRPMNQDDNVNTEDLDPQPLLCTLVVNNTDFNKQEDPKPNKNEIIDKIVNSLPSNVQKEVKEMFQKFINILALKTDELGKSKLFPHKINLLPGSRPIKQRAYRLTKNQTIALKKILKKLIRDWLIEPSSSQWSSPIVLVPKKNKDWRLCVDYRKLNDLTIKDSYSLPLIDDILSLAGDNIKILSTIDLYSGYHQIPMDTADKDKTAFTTMFGNYNFRVMPFGLCNAPATFQREMNRIFFDLIGDCMFVYIDDLIIFSKSLDEHICHLHKVFTILQENELKINLEKCSFFKTEVKILGHLLSTKGLSPLNDKVKVISQWLPPKNLKQVRSFLGAVSYYRKFIKNFAMIAKPLYQLLKKDAPFCWTEDCTNSFHLLKNKLIEAPILTAPNYSKPFIIRTDASRDGLGGVLLQKNQDGIEVPIYFESRTLSNSELNYSITDLEGKAVYHCVQKFKPYISGSPFNTMVYTDHKPLVYIFAKREPTNSRHLKWITELSILNVQVAYEEGKNNFVADALSRMVAVNNDDNNNINNNDLIMNNISSYKPASDQPVETINIITTNNNLPSNVVADSDSDTINTYMREFIKKKIININGIEYYKQGGKLRRIIKDKTEQIKLINAAHNIGHEGIYKTYYRLMRDYYWMNMKQDITNFIKCCHKCQTCRRQPLNHYTENIATPPGYPFSRVGLDLVGPLPLTKNGNKYIIVLVDYFTKWTEAEPLKSTESEDVIRFLKSVFSRHGIPEVLVTDNGPQFVSDRTKAFLDLHDVYVQYIATYHPASNGEVENRNREICKYLRLLGENDKQWDETLYSALWALRTSKSEVTKHSSFELLYGRRDLQPFELSLNIDRRNEFENEEEYILRKFITHDRWIREAIRNIETANKLWMDRRKQIRRLKSNYKPGDLVLVKVFNRRKLDPFFTGPLKIIKQELNTVSVCDPITGEVADRNIHLKNIIPYFTEINIEDDEE